MKSKKRGLTPEEIRRKIKRSKPLVFTPKEMKRPAGEDAKPDKPSFVYRSHTWEQDDSHNDFDHACGKDVDGISQHRATAGQKKGRIPKWYETEGGHVRLAYEIELLKERYRQMCVKRTEEGQIVVYGNLGPNNVLSKAYYLEAFLPDDFGTGSAVSVCLPNEDFPPGTPHLLPGNKLSLAHSDWTCNDTVCDVLAWATHWLAQYERYSRRRENRAG